MEMLPGGAGFLAKAQPWVQVLPWGFSDVELLLVALGWGQKAWAGKQGEKAS